MPQFTDQQIAEWVIANRSNPALVAQTMRQYGVTQADLQRALQPMTEAARDPSNWSTDESRGSFWSGAGPNQNDILDDMRRSGTTVDKSNPADVGLWLSGLGAQRENLQSYATQQLFGGNAPTDPAFWRAVDAAWGQNEDRIKASDRDALKTGQKLTLGALAIGGAGALGAFSPAGAGAEPWMTEGFNAGVTAGQSGGLATLAGDVTAAAGSIPAATQTLAQSIGAILTELGNGLVQITQGPLKYVFQAASVVTALNVLAGPGSTLQKASALASLADTTGRVSQQVGGALTNTGGGNTNVNTQGGGGAVSGTQRFDDGTEIVTYDDGSTVTLDSSGNILSSTPRTQTGGADSGTGGQTGTQGTGHTRINPDGTTTFIPGPSGPGSPNFIDTSPQKTPTTNTNTSTPNADWTAAQWASFLSGLGGIYASNNYANTLERLANRSWEAGQPSRARYEASYQPGFTMANEPGYMDWLNLTGRGIMAERSATSNRNPHEVPSLVQSGLETLGTKYAYPALQNYRGMNAQTGALATLAGQANELGGSAARAEMGPWNVAGATLGDIYNPTKRVTGIDPVTGRFTYNV